MVLHCLLHQSFIYSLSKPSVYLTYWMAATWLSLITWYAQCSSVYSASILGSQRTHPVCYIIHLKINCLFSVSAYLKENNCNTGTWCWPWQPRCDLCSILYWKIPVFGICIILVRKLEHFQKSLPKIWDIWGEKGTHFKSQIFRRWTSPCTYASALRPLHETHLQMCIHCILINTEQIHKQSCAFAK